MFLFLLFVVSHPSLGGYIAAYKLQLAKIQKISVMCACDQLKWCRYIYNSRYIFPLLRLYIMLFGTTIVLLRFAVQYNSLIIRRLHRFRWVISFALFCLND